MSLHTTDFTYYFGRDEDEVTYEASVSDFLEWFRDKDIDEQVQICKELYNELSDEKKEAFTNDWKQAAIESENEYIKEDGTFNWPVMLEADDWALLDDLDANISDFDEFKDLKKEDAYDMWTDDSWY